jgi:hypothetical protein
MSFKSAGIFVAVGSLAWSSIQPSIDCGPKEMCQVAVEPERHAPEREPGPVQTVSYETVKVSSGVERPAVVPLFVVR